MCKKDNEKMLYIRAIKKYSMDPSYVRIKTFLKNPQNSDDEFMKKGNKRPESKEVCFTK